MTHKVLVITTQQFFAEFYSSLFMGRTVTRSLDEARHRLCFNPERGIRLRGEGGSQEVKLELHDWFLPALYQSGADMALLSAAGNESLPLKAAPLHNLPSVQESGFFGRSRELWEIERALAVEGCRRFSITGFGGQGKTALALEAGRWLLRTGLFKRVCFISYAAYQGNDPVSLAVSTMSAALQESLVDAVAAEASLKHTPTLLIFDNLESLADGGKLGELLDAAVRWSEAGDSRVLLTSRQPDFRHPGYPLAGSYVHRQLALQGLQPADAVDWFDSLRRLPPRSRLKRPRRDVLIKLFELVGFHPLSISLLAQQLKVRYPTDIGERLEVLLEEQTLNQHDRSLLASLELSIEQLPKQCQILLPRLGIFAGGCLAEMVIRVTGLKEADWQELRSHLLSFGLMQDERVLMADMTSLRFHPALAPALWQKLDKEEHEQLLESYWQTYYHLSKELSKLDRTNPHAARAIARHELPNLLRAVHAALQSDRAEEGVDFADKVNRFLQSFGMQKEYQALTEAAAKAGSTTGSQAWYMSHSNLGEQLRQTGQIAAAEAVFQEIITGLGETPSYNRCVTLHQIGRCCEARGQPSEAERLYRQELTELAQLEQSEGVRKLTGSAWTDLADVLIAQGRHMKAEAACQAALEMMKELGDQRNMGAVLGQLGTLAMMQLKLAEAEERYKEALALFQSIGEPASEAVLWHQLGMVHQRARCWEEAEQAYRQASRLKEELGLLGGSNGAGASWQQLGQVCFYTNRLAEAEHWYRKALAARRAADDRPGIALTLNNLASLIAKDTARLHEARNLAEEALAIDLTLDPAAAEIWTTYSILADIASQQGDSIQSAVYRAKSRQAYFSFPAWRQQLGQHEELIAAVVQGNSVEAALSRYGKAWVNLKAAVQRILSGHRDEASLCEPLDYKEAAVIRAILAHLANEPMNL